MNIDTSIITTDADPHRADNSRKWVMWKPLELVTSKQ